MSIIIPVPT